MDLSTLHTIHFIGIGGIGMSALARYFHAHGIAITGYDRTPTALTKALQAEGMAIHFEDKIELAPAQPDLVIYTPAVPKGHQQLNHFQQSNIPVKKRAAVLGEIASGQYSIAVGGSHGKTTVSSILAHLLHETGADASAFLGGIATNYNSNFIEGRSGKMVVEADEFDRSFLQLHPDVAVVTAIDSDHLDIYGTQAELENTFYTFLQQIKADGHLVIKHGLPILQRAIGVDVITYHLKDNTASIYAEALRSSNGAYHFDIHSSQGNISDVILNIGGLHNVENTLAAVGVCQLLGCDTNKLKQAIASFKGVKRRFEYIVRKGDVIYIDDYAHHPREIEALLLSVRDLYPNRKITAVFQPHLFSRTKDLAQEFAASLDLADEVVLLDIYPAREEPMPGVTSALILDQLATPNKHLIHKENLLTWVDNHPPEIILTIGAGNIDQYVTPLGEMINNKEERPLSGTSTEVPEGT